MLKKEKNLVKDAREYETKKEETKNTQKNDVCMFLYIFLIAAKSSKSFIFLLPGSVDNSIVSAGFFM